MVFVWGLVGVDWGSGVHPTLVHIHRLYDVPGLCQWTDNGDSSSECSVKAICFPLPSYPSSQSSSGDSDADSGTLCHNIERYRKL